MRWRLAWLLLGMAAPLAAGPAPAWVGVWRGDGIMLCLQNPDRPIGLFYDARLLPVRLFGDASAASFQEDLPGTAPGSRWTEPKASGDRMAIKRDGRPLSLHRIAITGADPGIPCGDPAFTAPLLPKGERRFRHLRIHGQPYNAISVRFGKRFDDSELLSFRLPAASSAVQALNARLAIPAIGASDFWDCVTGSMSSANTNAYYSSTSTPEAVTRRLVAWRTETGYYCGGAHPDETSSWIVHDLNRGKDIDPWRWFIPGNVVEGRPAGRLRRLLMAKWDAKLNAGSIDGQCTDIEDWQLHVVAGGIAFSPSVPHVMAGCIDDAVISWRAVAPLLGRAGRTDTAELRAALAR